MRCERKFGNVVRNEDEYRRESEDLRREVEK